MNIGFSLWAAFDQFPWATKVIILEDDLLLSPDLLSYFHETSRLLDDDETLSHISAFGQNSYPLTAADLSTVLRVVMYPQYGWLTTRRWFNTMSSYWVEEEVNADWDWWLLLEGIRRGHHCIVPEVSRTGHVGSAGVHVSGFRQFYYYHTRIQSSTFLEMPTINTKWVSSADKYYQWLENEIRTATKLQLISSPCNYNIFPANKTGPFVLYVGATSKSDSEGAFYLMQTCLGTDETDVKEFFDGVLRLNVLPVTRSLERAKERRILYLVGCPLSSLCKYSKMISDWIIPRPAVLRSLGDQGQRRKRLDLQ